MTDVSPSRLTQTGREAIYAAERRAMEILDRTKRTAEQKTTEARQRSAGHVASIRGLIDQARSLSRQADSLIGAIDEAIMRARSSPGEEAPDITAELAPEEARDPDEAASSFEAQDDPVSLANVEPEPEPPVPVETERDERPSTGARLLAMQMAVSGSSRQEIEDRLRNEFEVADAKEIAASVLGEDA